MAETKQVTDSKQIDAIRARYSILPPPMALESDYGRPDGVDGNLIDPQHTSSVTSEEEYKKRAETEQVLAKEIVEAVGSKPYEGSSETPAHMFVLMRDGAADWSEPAVRRALGVPTRAVCQVLDSDEDTSPALRSIVAKLSLPPPKDIIVSWNEDQEGTDVIYVCVSITPAGSWVGFVQKVTYSDDHDGEDDD